MTTKSAKGMKGCLLMGGRWKVQDPDTGKVSDVYMPTIFRDEHGEEYAIRINDVSIEIIDDDAFIKVNDKGEKYIDYSDQTLGSGCGGCSKESTCQTKK